MSASILLLSGLGRGDGAVSRIAQIEIFLRIAARLRQQVIRRADGPYWIAVSAVHGGERRGKLTGARRDPIAIMEDLLCFGLGQIQNINIRIGALVDAKIGRLPLPSLSV